MQPARAGADLEVHLVRAVEARRSPVTAGVRRVLARIPGPAQKGLAFADRLQNLQGRLVLRERTGLPEEVVLIDDVFTTGATADECARLLREAGVLRIYVATLAID